jgi:hypothetical protein
MEGKDIVLLTRKEIREITGEREETKGRKNCRIK